VLAPPVDLGRGRRPEDIVEEYITKKTLLKMGFKKRKGDLRSRIECWGLDRGSEECVRELFGPTSSTLATQMTSDGHRAYLVQGMVKVRKYGISLREINQ